MKIKWPSVESWWRHEQSKEKYTSTSHLHPLTIRIPLRQMKDSKPELHRKRCHKDPSTFEASVVKRKGSQSVQGCHLVNSLNSFHLRQKSQVYWPLPSPSVELIFHDIHQDCWGAHLSSNSRDQQMAISQRIKIYPCNFNMCLCFFKKNLWQTHVNKPWVVKNIK